MDRVAGDVAPRPSSGLGDRSEEASLSPPHRDASDVATALRVAADELGHRPAVTVLLPEGRQEQSYTSLMQWAAKGAHFLIDELALEPGDAVGLDAPASWTSAAVALAAWWAGLTVTLDGPAPVTVVHESRSAPGGGEVLWLGDALDGAPRATVGEVWVRAVQSMPDQPPPPRGGATASALVDGADHSDQGGLLARARDDGDDVIGLEIGSVDAGRALVDVAVRPLVTRRPTVVLHGVGRDAAAGDRVARWR